MTGLSSSNINFAQAMGIPTTSSSIIPTSYTMSYNPSTGLMGLAGSASNYGANVAGLTRHLNPVTNINNNPEQYSEFYQNWNNSVTPMQHMNNTLNNLNNNNSNTGNSAVSANRNDDVVNPARDIDNNRIQIIQRNPTMLEQIGQGVNTVGGLVSMYNQYKSYKDQMKTNKLNREIMQENLNYARKERARLDQQRASVTSSYNNR